MRCFENAIASLLRINTDRCTVEDNLMTSFMLMFSDGVSDRSGEPHMSDM